MRLLIEIEIDHKLEEPEVTSALEMGIEAARQAFVEKEDEVKQLIADELGVLPEEVVKLTINLAEGDE